METSNIKMVTVFVIIIGCFAVLYPKIFQVPKEKIVEKLVEKDKVVTLPTQD